MKKVLFIVGSTRKNSFNLRLAREAERMLVPHAQVEYLDYADVPILNQDEEFPPPPAVERVRARVLEADGLWIFSPEYNHSIPGGLKNLLDWLSRPIDSRKGTSALKHRPVCFACAAGKSAAGHVRAALEDFALTASMRVIGGRGTGIILDADAFASDRLQLGPDRLEQLQSLAREFLNEI